MNNTKIRAVTLSALLAGVLLSGCVYGSGHYHGDHVAVSASAGGFYDGYYDGFYGPFVDGYWGGDGYFYYTDAGHAWHRDDARHFRRESAQGYVAIRGTGVHRDH